MKKFKDIIKRNPEPARGKLGINPMDPWSAKYGIAEDDTNEDLRKWFSQKWVRMDTKGNIKGDCARDPGEGKPKCLPQAKAHALGQEGRAKAARRKRREDPDPDRRGKPINVRTEENDMNESAAAAIAAATAIAKKKSGNYDSEGMRKTPYKNPDHPLRKSNVERKKEVEEACWTGYIAKGMKKKGNRMVPNCVPEEVKQEVDENHIAIAMGNMMDDEGSMVLNQLEQLERACGMIRSHIGKDYEKQLPAWVQSKITLATDYIDTVGNYLVSKNEKMTEEMVNEISKDKVERYISKVGDDQEKKHGFQRNMYSKLEPKRQRGVNRALDRLAVKEEHKVGDSVTVNSKFFGKKKGIVKKVDSQSVHVQRDGNKFSEKYPHDAVMKEEVLDELNYDTVKSLYQKRRTDFQGAQVGKKKKGKDVSAKNVSTSISRMMGYKPTQNQPQKEEVEQIDELNYDTVNTYDSKRKANPSSKKSPEVVTKNRTSSINRFMGKTRTQSSPMQGVKKELTPQQKTLQKDYHDSQRRGMSTEEVVNELSNELLGSYKKKAGEQASAADKAGDFKTGNKRFSGIVKATKKQFANDVKEETLDELNKDTLKSYLNKSTEIRKDSKSELKDIEKRPEIYKDNTDRAQQNLATKANKLKTTINKRTTGLNRAFNKLHGVAEAVDKKQMSKSARMIKALYKHHNVKEDMMDWEKGDKSTQSYGKKPNFKMTDKNADTSDTKFDARAVMKGGTTLTGQPRDMVEIDPSMKQRPGGQSTFTKDNMKKAPNN